MRWWIVASSMMLLGSVSPARAQTQVGVAVGVGITLPSVQIGIQMPAYPRLVQVPGYPVYYAPAASANYFFYDGAYWVFQADSWYVSSWYDGPWQQVEPDYVPLYVLRVPVRYYRRPPPYFRGWRADHPPRWGHRWGPDWERRRHGWDRWDRRHVPRAAPLPAYQRRYSGDRYPHAPEHQHSIRAEHYRYRPREDVTRQRFGDHGGWRGDPGDRGGRRGEPGDRGGWRGEPHRNGPGAQRSPAGPPRGDDGRRERHEARGHGNDRGHDNDRGHGNGRGWK